jgi:gliding motility-associated protein GldM
MNVLYANYENPIDIAIPGILSQNTEATISNGTLQRKGDQWVAIPSKIGVEAEVTVSARMDGRTQVVSSRKFRVRALPRAQAFLDYRDANGNPATFRGGRIPKATLVTISSIRAAVDDDMIRINYNVQKFETWILDSMGNTTREVSDGANFSQRQKDLIRGLSRGKSFIIKGIVASGPNGTEDVAPLEVIVN